MSKRPIVREVGQLDIHEWFTGRPAKKHAEYDIRLCGRCNGLELDTFIDEVAAGKHCPESHYGLTICDLGRINTWSKSCPLCRLFRFAAEKDDSKFPLYVLRLLSRKAVQGASADAKMVKELDVPLLAVTSNQEKDICSSGDLGYGLERTGYISWFTAPEQVPGPGRGRVLDSTIASFDLLASWLAFCREHHTKHCSITKNHLVQGFQLIDCTTNQIVTASSDMEYLALSYCWGPNPGEDAVEVRQLLWDRLPQTIRDAIEVTNRLHYRYLWCDRYCIPADPKIKHAQIQRMDIIYMQAQATLIAAAGEDAHFGLPGAGTRRREQQPTAVVGKHTLFSTLSSPAILIQKSIWMTRGWTYQEAMLSTRKIFFTKEQLYYECKSMHCSEAHPPDLEQWHRPDKQGFVGRLHQEIFELSTLNLALFDVWGYIAAYTSRKLSWDTDSLNGFLGVLAYLETPQNTLRSFWGIPITSQPDYFTRGREWYPSHCFLTGLTWTHCSKSRRRAGFPSWSWVGWEGGLYSNGISQSHTGCECDEKKTATIVGAETDDGELIDWESLQARLKTRDREGAIPRVIVVEANTVSFRFKHTVFRSDPVHKEPGWYMHAKVEWAELEYGVMEDCDAYTRLYLDKNTEELRRRLENEQFIGVLSGCASGGREEQTILVLDQRDDGIYERIGTARLKQHSIFEGITKTIVRNGAVKEFGGGMLRTLNERDEGKRSITRPLDVTYENWGMEKIWRRLRIG